MKSRIAGVFLCLPALLQAAPLSEDAAGKLAAHGMVLIGESLQARIEKLSGHLERASATRDQGSTTGNHDYFRVRRQSELLNRLVPKSQDASELEKSWDWIDANHRRMVRERLGVLLQRYWSGDREALEIFGKESADLDDDLSPRHVERDRTPTRAEWNSEAEKVPCPVWMDPIAAAPAPPKRK